MRKGSHHTEEAKVKISKNPKGKFQKGNTINSINYIGKKFGKLTIIDQYKRSDSKIMALCLCDCGRQKSFLANRVKNGYTKSCGCLGHPGARVDLTGQRFGRLTVIAMSEKKTEKYNKILWECECDCGGVKLVEAGDLRHGGVLSCGCSMKGENNHNWTGGKKTFACDECGEDFPKYCSMVKDYDYHFCGNECRHKWRAKFIMGENNPRYKPKVKKPCGFCGKGLELHPSKAKSYENNFCPREEGENLSKCHIAWMSENYAGKGNPRYNGWSSVRPYAPIFGDQKYRNILWARHGDVCMNPNCLGEHLDKPKFLHHIDHEKENTLPENQIGLCSSCNGIAENKETWDYYIKLYQGITAELNNQEAMEYFNNYYTNFMDSVFSNPEQQLSLLEAVNQ